MLHMDVAVVDILNVLVQTRVEDKKDMAIIKLHGVLVGILVEIAPDVYKDFISKDKKGHQSATGTMPERTVRYNGCKSSILVEAHEESDKNQIHNQTV